MGTLELENAVLAKVLQAGALTTRRVIAEHGPKPNWSRLLREGYLREVHTPYGAVLAVTPRAHGLNAEKQVVPDAPYLTGPSAVADRAYQLDALALLEAEGYTLHRHEYKRSGKVGYQAGTTSQIVRTVLRVPPAYAARLKDTESYFASGRYFVRRVLEPEADQWGIFGEVLGYPSLYASIGGGGIGLPRVRTLLRRHHLDIDNWRHPLILAVPEEGQLRSLLRVLEAERAQANPRNVSSLYPRVRLLILPRPAS
ncbi:hypothetical protein [Deinococcus aestuarii]|uniref:hypothetical protein n=1 Tax=Deinococcus aestuarii TaxID=2774531 RepID=UPI001C0BDE3A|nr:hypothetical protein [Deinococcus aestuarii]